MFLNFAKFEKIADFAIFSKKVFFSGTVRDIVKRTILRNFAKFAKILDFDTYRKKVVVSETVRDRAKRKIWDHNDHNMLEHHTLEIS